VKKKPVANPVAVIPGGKGGVRITITAAEIAGWILAPDTGCPDCGKPLVVARSQNVPYFRHRPGEKHAS
jgi:hypothetical protein